MKDATPEELYDIFDLLWFNRAEPTSLPCYNASKNNIGQKVIAANENQIIVGTLTKCDTEFGTVLVEDNGEYEVLMLSCQPLH